MEFKKEEDFIFPARKFKQSKINNYKDYLIQIPTGRKNNDNVEIKIPCLFLKNQKSKNLLISFHCNGIDMFSSFDTVKEVAEQLKMNCLVSEYPGYSIYNSPKSSTQCLQDSLLIYDFVLQHMKNITEKNIYIFGRSLGTGPAVYLSSKRNPAGTFLLSPYTTFGAVAKPHHKEDFYNKLTKHLRSIDFIENVKCPLCIFHGNSDKLIDYHEAIELHEKCSKNEKREIHLIDKMGHNDVFNFYNIMLELAKKFIDKFCPFDNEVNQVDSLVDFDKNLYYFSDVGNEK